MINVPIFQCENVAICCRKIRGAKWRVFSYFFLVTLRQAQCKKSKQKGLRRWKSIGFYCETFATKTKLLLRRQTVVFDTLPYSIKTRFTFLRRQRFQSLIGCFGCSFNRIWWRIEYFALRNGGLIHKN
jgi:hypothetical protein